MQKQPSKLITHNEYERALLMSGVPVWSTHPDCRIRNWPWVSHYIIEELTRRDIPLFWGYWPKAVGHHYCKHEEGLIAEWETDGVAANSYIQDGDALFAELNLEAPDLLPNPMSLAPTRKFPTHSKILSKTRLLTQPPGAEEKASEDHG